MIRLAPMYVYTHAPSSVNRQTREGDGATAATVDGDGFTDGFGFTVGAGVTAAAAAGGACTSMTDVASAVARAAAVDTAVAPA